MGIKLFLHAVRLVLGNFWDALRISAIVYIVPLLLTNLVLAAVDPRSPWIVLFGLLASTVSLVGSLCVAVAWHRFVLLEAKPSALLPEVNGRRLLTYLGNTLLLALITVPIMIGVAMLTGPLAFIGGPGPAFFAVLVGIFLSLVIGYRLGLILPASSIDRRLHLGEAWEATRGATGDILVLSFVSALCALLVSLPALLLPGSLELLRTVIQVVAGWLVLLVGVSILTTLYGHYVEGRAVGGSSPHAARSDSEPDFS